MKTHSKSDKKSAHLTAAKKFLANSVFEVNKEYCKFIQKNVTGEVVDLSFSSSKYYQVHSSL